MTHDELLALLNAKSDSDEVHALRAVVELHKPIFNSYYEIKGYKGCTGCEHIYPCLTIQAIEKELE